MGNKRPPNYRVYGLLLFISSISMIFLYTYWIFLSPFFSLPVIHRLLNTRTRDPWAILVPVYLGLTSFLGFLAKIGKEITNTSEKTLNKLGAYMMILFSLIVIFIYTYWMFLKDLYPDPFLIDIFDVNWAITIPIYIGVVLVSALVFRNTFRSMRPSFEKVAIGPLLSKELKVIRSFLEKEE